MLNLISSNELDIYIATKLGWVDIIDNEILCSGYVTGKHNTDIRTLIPNYSSNLEAAMELASFISEQNGVISMSIVCSKSTYSSSIEIENTFIDGHVIAFVESEATLPLAICKSFYLYLEYIEKKVTKNSLIKEINS